MIPKKYSRILFSTAAMLLLLLLPLLFAGCASSSITQESTAHRIVSANAAVSQSIVNDARKYAPIELRTAERKLEDARARSNSGDFRSAYMLAQQVELDAKFAEAKARSNKASKIVDLLLENNRILEDEIKRASTAR